MKKITFLIIWLSTLLSASSCVTDIYFGNGVWNTDTQAAQNLNALRQFMQSSYNARLSREDEEKTYFFKLAYNPTHGTQNDLLETYWQLRESGQISQGYFVSQWKLLTYDRGEEEMRKAMHRVEMMYNADADTMFQGYKTESLNPHHNILLVAHSQGNLFGNKMYTLLTAQEKEKFQMVSVATPAGYVMKPGQKSPYVTADWDYVINRIENALPGNVSGFGHTFIGTYIGTSFEARTKIAEYTKNAYDTFIDACANNDNSDEDNTTSGNSDDNTTGGTDDGSNDNNTTDPTKDPNKVCVSNFFKYYGDGKIHEDLKKGDKDEGVSNGTKHQVKELQEFLEAFGYDVGSSGADGWFGGDTKTALIDFQSNNDLDADGIVGPNTREVMNGTNCYDKE